MEKQLKRIGKKFKMMRVEQDLSQGELAYICGTSTNQISKIENGTANPGLKNLLNIADKLGCIIEIELQPVKT